MMSAPVAHDLQPAPDAELPSRHALRTNHRRPLGVRLLDLGPSSVLIGLVAALAMTIRLFVPFVTGLADNGEGTRFLCQLGLVPASGAPTLWSFIVLDWKPGEVGDGCVAAPGSELWLLTATQWVTGVFGGAEGHLNLRFLIAGYALATAALIALFAFAIRRNLGTRIALAVPLFVVLADGAFSNYSGSGYAEFPGLLGVVMMAVAALYLATSGVKQWLGLALLTIGAVLLLTSTMQAATTLLPIAILLLCTTIRFRRRAETLPWWNAARLSRTVAGKIVPAALAVALVLPVLWMHNNAPKDAQAVAVWDVVAVNILGASTDPAADLEELGLPQELTAYAGRSVASEPSIRDSDEWDAISSELTYTALAGFFAGHPDRAAAIVNQAGNDWFATRPGYLGSFEQADETDRGQRLDASLISDLGRIVGGFGVIPLLLIWAGLAWGAIMLLRRSQAGTLRRGFATATLFLLGISIVQFFTASFGEAVEHTKHMVFGILALALAPVVVVAGACSTRFADDRLGAIESED